MKKNFLVAEKYIQASIFIASGNKEKSFKLFEEIYIEKINFIQS